MTFRFKFLVVVACLFLFVPETFGLGFSVGSMSRPYRLVASGTEGYKYYEFGFTDEGIESQCFTDIISEQYVRQSSHGPYIDETGGNITYMIVVYNENTDGLYLPIYYLDDGRSLASLFYTTEEDGTINYNSEVTNFFESLKVKLVYSLVDSSTITTQIYNILKYFLIIAVSVALCFVVLFVGYGSLRRLICHCRGRGCRDCRVKNGDGGL